MKSQDEEGIRASFGAWEGPLGRRNLVCVIVLSSDRFFLVYSTFRGFPGWKRDGDRVGSKELNEVFEGWDLAWDAVLGVPRALPEDVQAVGSFGKNLVLYSPMGTCPRIVLDALAHRVTDRD